MESVSNESYLNLDPRTKLVLLFITNIVIFSTTQVYIEIAVVLLLMMLISLCGCFKSILKLVTVFFSLILIQFYVIPVLPPILVMTFNVLAVYARKILPCLMIGTLIVKTTPVRLIMLSLRKWKVPQKILIPLAITIRYFPSIKEEYLYIKDAMKLRGIKGIVKKVECVYVPLLISATHTAEELSEAAITRGIENPVPKTSVINIKFHFQDYFSLVVGVICMIIAFTVKIQI